MAGFIVQFMKMFRAFTVSCTKTFLNSNRLMLSSQYHEKNYHKIPCSRRWNGIANLTRSQALRLSQLNSFLDHLGEEIPFTVKAKTMR